MAQPETRTRHSVLRALRERNVHAIAVENGDTVKGTPDINYCGLDAKDQPFEGWLELKRIKSFPVRPRTVVRLPEYTLAQRCFLRDRWNAGGDARLLVHVERYNGCPLWLLFDGVTAHSTAGKVPRDELLRAAIAIHAGPLDAAWLVSELAR